MKQRLPGILFLLLGLVLCVTAARRDRSAMGDFVRQNREELTAFAEEVLEASLGAEFSYPGVESVCKQVYMESGSFYRPYVRFTTDIAGGETGFYYSPSDIPIPKGDVTLTRNNTGWFWTNRNMHGTTVKICENWYSFESHL